MAGWIEVALVVAVPLSLTTAIVPETPTACSAPVGLPRAADIPTRVVPIVEVEMRVVDVVDDVAVRSHQWAAAASHQQPTE